ncbi:MAG TPA: glycosyltransferase family 2 protein [bacterium]|nr:glycosyltransferase family 2 protein [bacterium]
MPRVSVLIPHHRNPRLLTPLFTSLYKMDMDPAQVEFVLVDNGSTDGSAGLVRREFPAVKIFSLGRNEGFAPALNKAARAYESPWLCFLNNDVQADPDWLSNLLHAAHEIDAPCFSSHLLNWTGRQTQFAGGWINIFGKGFESHELRGPRPYEIFFPCGCGMLIRRNVFLRAGGFDDDYFMLYEDVDLGWRLRLLGYPIYLVPDARLLHRGHASLKEVPYAEKALYYERNSLATLYKNLASDSLAVVLPLAVREALYRAKGISSFDLPFRVSPDGTAILEAVRAFFAALPRWKEKRGPVQEARQVEDREIFERFFPNPTRLWAYSDFHYHRIHHPSVFPIIEDIFQQARERLGL